MSIIVAYKYKGVVYMGADTQITSGSEKIYARSEYNYKISKLQNGILLGCTGSVVTHQILAANQEMFSLTKNKKLTKEHIVCEILPQLLEVLKKEGKLEYDKEKFKVETDISIILAYKDSLFKIFDNFKVTKHNKFQLAGSGIDFALHAINNIDESANIEDELVRTMKISSKYLTNVGGPYVVINTKDLQFKIKEEL